MAFDPSKFLKTPPKSASDDSTPDSKQSSPKPEPQKELKDKQIAQDKTTEAVSPDTPDSTFEEKDDASTEEVSAPVSEKPKTPLPTKKTTSPSSPKPKPEPEPSPTPNDQNDTTHEPKTVPTSHQNKPYPLNKSEFYKFPVRMVRKNDKWFFLLKDLFDIVDIADQDRYLTKLRNSPELTTKWNDLVETISFIGEKETGKEQFANKEGVLEITKTMEEVFPGPFVRWLNKVVKLKHVGTTPPTDPNALQTPQIPS